MYKKLMSSVVLAILILSSSSLAEEGQGNKKGQRDVLTLSSDSVGAMVLNKKIKLMMRDGTYVEGKVIQASQESITLKVKKTEPKGRFPQKEAVLATSDIGSVHLRKGGTIAAPIALGILGGILGTALTFSAGRDAESKGYIGVVTAGAVGGSIGGALLGREIVKKTVTINVQQSQEP